MSFEGLINIRKAITTLNPRQVRELADRDLSIALYAPDDWAYRQMEEYLLQDLKPGRRRDSAALLVRGSHSSAATHDLAIYHERIDPPHRSLIYHPERPDAVVYRALAQHPDLGVALSRSFVPFRNPFINSVISKTAKENTLFSVATALPDIIPTLIEVPWAIAEFASDTAFLTMNQVRMAFLIAAASDREAGYMEQKSEVAAVIGSAFGWRALAKQLVGKIPFGGGLIAKAGVAYAGTKVLGVSLNHFYSVGFTYSRDERDRIYTEAFKQGRTIATRILKLLRPDVAAKFGDTAPGSRADTGNAKRAGASFR